MLEADISHVEIHLFGDQHGKGCVGALSHLDDRHDDRDFAGRIEADEGVGREDSGFRGGVVEWNPADHQAAADGSAGFQEGAAG